MGPRARDERGRATFTDADRSATSAISSPSTGRWHRSRPVVLQDASGMPHVRPATYTEENTAYAIIVSIVDNGNRRRPTLATAGPRPPARLPSCSHHCPGGERDRCDRSGSPRRHALASSLTLAEPASATTATVDWGDGTTSGDRHVARQRRQPQVSPLPPTHTLRKRSSRSP